MSSERFFLVWADNGGTPTVKHPTYEAAYRECERLAGIHGKPFHVLERVCTMQQIKLHVDGPSPREYFDHQAPF